MSDFPTRPDSFFKAFVYDQIARVARALASPQRLILMNILVQGEHSVDELSQHSGMSVANTSRHLQILRGANLVVVRQEANLRYYRVASEPCVLFFDALINLAQERSAELKQARQEIASSESRRNSVGREELSALARRQEVVIIDVRPESEYRAGHLPGAVSMPLSELEERLNELPPQAEVVAYCRGRYCVLADSAVEILTKAGYPARRTDETTRAWADAGMPLETP